MQSYSGPAFQKQASCPSLTSLTVFATTRERKEKIGKYRRYNITLTMLDHLLFIEKRGRKKDFIGPSRTQCFLEYYTGKRRVQEPRYLQNNILSSILTVIFCVQLSFSVIPERREFRVINETQKLHPAISNNDTDILNSLKLSTKNWRKKM